MRTCARLSGGDGGARGPGRAPSLCRSLRRQGAAHRGPRRGLDLIALDAPHLFDRPGNPYLDPTARTGPTTGPALRRALPGRGRHRGAGKARLPARHLHAMTGRRRSPRLCRFNGGRRPKTVMTVHNIAFQGQFPALASSLARPAAAGLRHRRRRILRQCRLPEGRAATADRITTVSPTYAQEICTPEFGMGLDGLLRAPGGRADGIVNGIDTDVWNPATDPRSPPYTAPRRSKRARPTSAPSRTALRPR
jgi:starch synthase